MDPYDKVRMRLLRDDEELYKAYLKTTDQLSSDPRLQPKKIEVPCYFKWPIVLLEFIFILILLLFSSQNQIIDVLRVENDFISFRNYQN